MKARRLLRGAAILLVVLAACVGLLFVPAIQRTLFVAIASAPDRKVSVEEFRLGPGGLRVAGLEVAADGALARVPRLEAAFSWAALLGGRIEVETLDAEDVFLRLPESPEDAPPADAETGDETGGLRLPRGFGGVLPEQWPVVLGEALVTGRLDVPGRLTTGFRLEARDLRPGGEGEVGFRFTPTDSAPETVPETTGQFRVAISDGGRVDGISTEGRVVSRAEEVPGELKWEGSVRRTAGGEEYRIDVSSADFFPSGTLNLSGSWDRRAPQLALELIASGEGLGFLDPFVEDPLPAVAFRLRARAGATPGEVLREASLDVGASVPPGVVPGIGEGFSLDGDFDLDVGEEGAPRIRGLRASVAPEGDGSAGSSPWLDLRLEKPLPLDFAGQGTFPQGRLGVLRLDLPGPLLERFAEGWEFSRLRGGWILSGKDGTLSLNPGEPWTVSAAVRDAGELVPVRISPTLEVTTGKRLGAAVDLALGEKPRVFEASASGDWDPSGEKGAAGRFEFQGPADVWRALVPGGDGVPEAGLSGNGKASWSATEGLVASGRVAAEGLALGDAAPGDGTVEVRSFRWNEGEAAPWKADFSAKWDSKDTLAKAENVSVSLSGEEGGPWTVRKASAQVHVEAKAPVGGEGTPAPRGSIRTGFLPGRSDFRFLREKPALPVFVEKAEVGWSFEGGTDSGWEGTVRASGLLPGADGGELSLAVSPAGRDRPVATAKARLRLDADGRLGKAEVSFAVPGEWHEAVPFGLDAEGSFVPESPVEPFSWEISAAESGVPLASGAVELEAEEAVATVEGSFSDWGRTPLRSSFPNLASGRFRVRVGFAEESASWRGNLAAVAPLDGLEAYDLDLSGRIPRDGIDGATGKMTLVDGKDRESDVGLRVRDEADEALKIDLEGKRIDVEAARRFAAIWGRPGEPDGGQAERGLDDPAEASGDDHWPLADLARRLEVTFSLDEILLADLPEVTEFEGEAVADASAASLRMAGNWSGNGPFGGEFRVERQADGSVRGSGKAKADSIAAGPLLRRLQPGETPSVEGTFRVGFDAEGEAARLPDLPDRLAGTLVVEGEDGVVRSLKPEKRVTRLVDVGSTAGLLLGDKLNRPGVAALGNVARLFKEVPFDSLRIELRRTGGQRTGIEDLRFRGPYLSLDGSGRVEASPLSGIPLAPMRLELRFGAKPPLERPLVVLGLVGKERNDGGYRLWREPVRLAGSLENPDTSDLWGPVVRAVERAATVRPEDLAEEEEPPPEDGEKDRKPEERLIEEGVNRLFDILGG